MLQKMLLRGQFIFVSIISVACKSAWKRVARIKGREKYLHFGNEESSFPCNVTCLERKMENCWFEGVCNVSSALPCMKVEASTSSIRATRCSKGDTDGFP